MSSETAGSQQSTPIAAALDARSDLSPCRRVMLVHHSHRSEAVIARNTIRRKLLDAGFEVIDESEAAGEDLELIVVLGGDGTILRAAQYARDQRVALLGVNLGHVGFLAEAEQEHLPEVVSRIVEGRYEVEERMTLDITVTRRDGSSVSGWAINEASLEKQMPAHLIEVSLGVDQRGVSTFGCDSVVVATPTGSTAYAFSGGGPVVWPDVSAMLVVPIAAHALFTRPLVLSPNSRLDIYMSNDERNHAIVWLDGTRSIQVGPGDTVTATRGCHPVRLARLSRAPFSERLVRKFKLPVDGWKHKSDA